MLLLVHTASLRVFDMAIFVIRLVGPVGDFWANNSSRCPLYGEKPRAYWSRQAAEARCEELRAELQMPPDQLDFVVKEEPDDMAHWFIPIG